MIKLFETRLPFSASNSTKNPVFKKTQQNKNQMSFDVLKDIIKTSNQSKIR